MCATRAESGTADTPAAPMRRRRRADRLDDRDHRHAGVCRDPDGPINAGARRLAVKIAVKPSAPPMIPIDAALCGEKSSQSAPILVEVAGDFAGLYVLGEESLLELGDVAEAL
jgi:hypothetical protein